MQTAARAVASLALIACGPLTRAIAFAQSPAIPADTGRPVFGPPARIADVVHYNRVEGLYTGFGGRLALNQAAPGVVIRANAGWAWAERTARGRVAVDRSRALWTQTFRVGRTLDVTNDFRNVLDSGATIGGLGGDDPYNYVDRRAVSVGLVRWLDKRRASVRVDYGLADDRYTRTRVKNGLLNDSTYAPNRGVDEGSYRRFATSGEWHPQVYGDARRSGFSTRLSYERGDGTLNYQRAEARVMTRWLSGGYVWTVRGEAGALFGAHMLPQQLFELGGGQNLPGYDNNTFAGTRAAGLRTNLIYTSRLLADSIRLVRHFVLPPIAPGISVGVQSAWADVRTQAGAGAMTRLGQFVDSTGALRNVSRPTGRVRASASVGLRFLGGALLLGVARPIDGPGRWRYIISGGRTL